MRAVTHTHAHPEINTRKHINTYTHTNAFIRSKHTHAHTHTHTHTPTHTHTYILKHNVQISVVVHTRNHETANMDVVLWWRKMIASVCCARIVPENTAAASLQSFLFLECFARHGAIISGTNCDISCDNICVQILRTSSSHMYL